VNSIYPSSFLKKAFELHMITSKRFLDLLITVPVLTLFFPVLLVLSILIRIKLGSPVIFTQERPGLNGKSFTMYKFRTMTDARDAAGNLLPDDDRFTGFGKFIRSTSLDELPGLFNVLNGDMSLVGPRPLLVRYLDRYSPEQARRHEVKPGITGWAQVNGRNAISWDKKFELDVWYVDNHNLLLDLKILLLTIKKVLIREGISQANHSTMSEFLGSSVDRE
jgi:lipopolysaccharide/colanic/teichoic acid biosynthesis glycosyltransferase